MLLPIQSSVGSHISQICFVWTRRQGPTIIISFNRLEHWDWLESPILPTLEWRKWMRLRSVKFSLQPAQCHEKIRGSLSIWDLHPVYSLSQQIYYAPECHFFLFCLQITLWFIEYFIWKIVVILNASSPFSFWNRTPPSATSHCCLDTEECCLFKMQIPGPIKLTNIKLEACGLSTF